MLQGAIVLCGGRSSRMGLPKLSLPFGPELMLPRVVRLLRTAVESVVVVAAPEQALPPLPGEVQIVRDRREGRGPLEGLFAGLSSLPPGVEAAYATSCDVPLLVPGFVQRMFELLGDQQIAVPTYEGYHHPLAAVYRREVVAKVAELLAADRLRPIFLFEAVPTRVVQPEELLDVDPQFDTLMNLNRPADYLAALERAGLTADPEVVAQLTGKQ